MLNLIKKYVKANLCLSIFQLADNEQLTLYNHSLFIALNIFKSY